MDKNVQLTVQEREVLDWIAKLLLDNRTVEIDKLAHLLREQHGGRWGEWDKTIRLALMSIYQKV